MEKIYKLTAEGGGGVPRKSQQAIAFAKQLQKKNEPKKPAPKPTTTTKPGNPQPDTTGKVKNPAKSGPLSYDDWLKANPGPTWPDGSGDGKSHKAKGGYDYYVKNFKPSTVVPSDTKPKPTDPGKPTSVVPGSVKEGTGQVNVVDFAGKLVPEPNLGLRGDDPATKDINESMHLSNRVPDIDENAAGTNINPKDARYSKQLKEDAALTTGTAAQGTVTSAGNAATASATPAKTAQGYTAQTTQQNIAQNGQMTAAQGTVSDQALIDADEVPQLDLQGTYSGVNADGSINYTGLALNDYASQDLNAVDPKATMQGQLALLQEQFTDPLTGEPKIPMWAAGTARSVSRIAAFKGMTGTAATAAMAQAIMEASIPIAQQDAQFFQTLTIKNLDNKQASILNKANVLAKFDLTNVDNRMAAAIENSKAFLQMDLANLENRQQAEIINTQARVQSILEDAKAVNAARMFSADEANDMAKFYDELNANIKQFNASQINNMKQFNASEANKMSQFNAAERNTMTSLNVTEANAMSKFNAELENNRQQFYKNMQYNIDIANAKWRQTVTLTESQQKFEAAATDVKNMVGISNEQLNRLWDRSDALLDYLWKSTDNELDRKSAMAIAKTQGKMSADAADKAGFGSILGSITGAIAGSDQFLDFLF